MAFLFFPTLIVAFYMAWNIGANDVANAMGTAVGSKSLSLKRALILSVIFEFMGAILFGDRVVTTMGTGIVNPNSFPEASTFSLGMFSALISVSLWLNFATYMGYPVSTTHSLLGAIVGFGMVAEGDIYGGKVLRIASGFALSPIIGGLLSYIFFHILSMVVLNGKNFNENSKKYFPLMATLTFSSQLLFLFHVKFYDNFSIYFSAMFLTLNYIFFYILCKLFLGEKSGIEIFKYLQAISAIFVAFAHGANDVSNSIGPVWGIIGEGDRIPLWLLLFGGIGVVLGILTKGHRVIDTIGERITYLTPSLGFISSFAASITVLFSSRIGLPISTTHTIVGSIMGVTFAKKMKKINRNTIIDIFKVWIVTMPANFLLCILIFFFLKFLNINY